MRNEDQEGRMYNEIVRVRENESRRNQVIYRVHIYCTKSNFLINGPQMQNFILEVIQIIQQWSLENKTAIDISDQKTKESIG